MTVVTFHAHPDDEAIFTAGISALLSDAGHRVVLVVATRGERGNARPDVLVAGQTLADRRSAETRWSAAVLGVQRVAFLDYTDSGMDGDSSNGDPTAFMNAPVEEAAASLSAILREERATTLTVYDDHGVYGHPDHIQVHRVGLVAARLSEGVTIYEATANRDRMQRALDVVDRGALPAVTGLFGEPEAAITHGIDVRGVLERKRRAMAAHSSQMGETSFFLGLPSPAFEYAFGTEWFIRRDDEGETPIDALPRVV